jgi:hypothetical protein
MVSGILQTALTQFVSSILDAGEACIAEVWKVLLTLSSGKDRVRVEDWKSVDD